MTGSLAVAAALSACMGDVQSISKDQQVKHGDRFHFRGVDDVMQAVGPALRKHGVIFAPSRVVSVEHERYETAKGSPMDGVTVVVEYTITGPAGDTMTAAAAGQASDSGDKAVPKAMSVAYRTVLLQALCIPTGDPDPDLNVHERAQVDPCVALRKTIAELGTARGWTLTDTCGDRRQPCEDRVWYRLTEKLASVRRLSTVTSRCSVGGVRWQYSRTLGWHPETVA